MHAVCIVVDEQSTTHPPEYYGGKYEVQPTPGTTHISAMDKDGLAVGMTSTVRATREGNRRSHGTHTG